MSTLIVQTNGVTQFTVTKREKKGFCTSTLAKILDLLSYGCDAFKKAEGENPCNREEYLDAFAIALKDNKIEDKYYHPLRFVVINNHKMERRATPLYRNYR